MDLYEVLRQLKLDKERIERAIAQLEQLQNPDGGGLVAKRRRGRKSMSAAERKVVSERMKRYWQDQRQGKLG